MKDDPSEKASAENCPAGQGGCSGGDAATWPYKQQVIKTGTQKQNTPKKQQPNYKDLVAKTLAKAKQGQPKKDVVALETQQDLEQNLGDSSLINKAFDEEAIYPQIKSKGTKKIGKQPKGSYPTALAEKVAKKPAAKSFIQLKVENAGGQKSA